MRLLLIKLWVGLVHIFDPFDCEKEAMGYTCRHQMHGNVPECGKWSKVRGYNNGN